MEKYRPRTHFSAEKYVINDPNGLVYHEGKYHLFHQYNIEEQIHWGHAVSTDLVHWERLPLALFPDEIGQIWSGSVVVDEESDRMAAFFTYSEHGTKRQSQGLAFSYDGGMIWEKYPGNPILTAERPDFRDPKVFRYEDKWVMVLSGGDCVLLYESKDLVTWSPLSSFKGNEESHCGIWECPDLFPMKAVQGEDFSDRDVQEEKWVLTVSVNDGSPAGGTGMLYFVGSFDGTCFESDHNCPDGRWLDYGKDFYAGITWNNAPDGRRLMIAWADNWQYRDYLPTYPFKGQMSCVRELTLHKKMDGYSIIQMPVEEMELLRGNKKEYKQMQIGDGDEWILITEQQSLEINLNCLSKNIKAQRFGIRLGTGEGKMFQIEFVPKEGICVVDRRNSGINAHEKFPGIYKGNVDFEKDQISVKLLLDVSQTELFVNEGELIMTNLVFPEKNYEFKLYAEGGAWKIESCVIYILDEAMNKR
ncbi:MAG: glycoside hydrolase family 32 protein [Acetatifactor sp.]